MDSVNKPPAPSPWTARHAISVVMLSDTPASTDPTMNTAMAAW